MAAVHCPFPARSVVVQFSCQTMDEVVEVELSVYLSAWETWPMERSLAYRPLFSARE